MAKHIDSESANQTANENDIKNNSTSKAVANQKPEASREKKNKKTKKQNEKPKRNLVKESVAEIKKVTWPSFKEVVKNTLIVLLIVIICTAALFLIDRVLSWLYQLMIDGTISNWWF